MPIIPIGTIGEYTIKITKEMTKCNHKFVGYESVMICDKCGLRAPPGKEVKTVKDDPPYRSARKVAKVK